MRSAALVLSALGLVACQNLDTGEGGADAGATSADGGSKSADAGIVGGGCGREASSGAELCAATTMCPDVVVDTQAMPSCGFQIRGGAVDLVCACGTSICPMGIFTTCAAARRLLETQTEQGVCVQLAEGRCVELAAGAESGGEGGNPACDRGCLADCGGGAACASVCNCD